VGARQLRLVPDERTSPVPRAGHSGSRPPNDSIGPTEFTHLRLGHSGLSTGATHRAKVAQQDRSHNLRHEANGPGFAWHGRGLEASLLSHSREVI